MSKMNEDLHQAIQSWMAEKFRPKATENVASNSVPAGFEEWFLASQCELYNYYDMALAAWKAGQAYVPPTTKATFACSACDRVNVITRPDGDWGGEMKCFECHTDLDEYDQVAND